MSGFDKDWLALREPFDREARSPELAGRLISALANCEVPRIVDLGGGTGANFRVLAPLIGRDQHWRVLDLDRGLLDHALGAIAEWARESGWAARREGPQTVVVEAATGRWSLTVEGFDLSAALEICPFESFDAVVTTAFLDLVSAAWVERFAHRLAQSQRPFLATLTVDGRRSWSPAHSDDAWIESAFRDHQGGDKGFGPSLGVDATEAASRALGARGFRVQERASDWRIEGVLAHAMLARLMEDSAAVAYEVCPAESSRIEAWRRLRLAQIERAELGYLVGHRDLLALPA
jgi:SAM-dependent methyltransferase